MRWCCEWSREEAQTLRANHADCTVFHMGVEPFLHACRRWATMARGGEPGRREAGLPVGKKAKADKDGEAEVRPGCEAAAAAAAAAAGTAAAAAGAPGKDRGAKRRPSGVPISKVPTPLEVLEVRGEEGRIQYRCRTHTTNVAVGGVAKKKARGQGQGEGVGEGTLRDERDDEEEAGEWLDEEVVPDALIAPFVRAHQP